MKNTSINTLCLVAIMLLLAACSKSKQSGESVSASDSTKVSEQANEGLSQIDLPLKGIYATSTKTPQNSFSYYNLFDGDPNSYWATMPGAGPDEGIMLYFDKPVAIDMLEITQPKTDTNSQITDFAIYSNGQKVEQRGYKDNRVGVYADNIYSLFIRLDKLKDIVESTHESMSSTSFPNNKNAAISELKIFLKGGGKANILMPKQVKGSITASSTLSPDLSYSVRNLFDSRSEFAWAEGDKGNGIGQSLNVQFQDEQTITGLEIMNGYQRSDKHFSANTRVKSLILSDEHGTQTEGKLTDSQGEQMVLLATPLKGKNIKIQIKDVYPGTAYKDMVISEIKFKNNDAEFVIEDNTTESLKSELIKKTKGTILEKVLDHRIGNELKEMDGYISSLILRSDYTFVYYNKGWSEDGQGPQTDETVADGSWEIKELSNDKAAIRIFGKLTKQSKTQDFYTGETSSDDLQIFQDVLTINENGIQPAKFLSALVFDSQQK
jgi:hypothetical protein